MKNLRLIQILITAIFLLSSFATYAYSSNNRSLFNKKGPAGKAVVVAWAAPKSDTKGAPISISDLGGYRIYLGETRSKMTPHVDVKGGHVNKYKIVGLPVGTYYLALSSYDVYGNESRLSRVAVVKVQKKSGWSYSSRNNKSNARTGNKSYKNKYAKKNSYKKKYANKTTKRYVKKKANKKTYAKKSSYKKKYAKKTTKRYVKKKANKKTYAKKNTYKKRYARKRAYKKTYAKKKSYRKS